MRLLRYLTLIALIVVSSSLFANSSLLQQIFDEGMELFMKKDYRGSSSYLGQVVDMQPNHHQARYYFVLSLVFQGRTNEALAHLTILRKYFPQNTAYSSLESDLRRNMMPRKTTKEFETTSENIITENRKTRQVVKNKNTEKLDSDFVKVTNLIDEENYEQAEILLKRFIKTKKSDIDKGLAYAFLGLIYYNRQNYPLAVEQYKKSFEYKTGDFEANFLTASAYINMQMPDEALKYFKIALKINDDDIFARIYMADIYAKQAKYAEAEQVYKDILKIDPMVTDAEVGLANLQLEQGFIEK
ncbi:MAG: tetratricopeptide repeat protein, partial [Candidatus Riflebacteria bacterium]|nr:tetratricopeptide repeat protein [Candidatus Riflebacteria bacterium]